MNHLEDNPWVKAAEESLRQRPAIEPELRVSINATMAVAWELARLREVMEQFLATANRVRTQMEVERKAHR